MQYNINQIIIIIIIIFNIFYVTIDNFSFILHFTKTQNLKIIIS